MIDSAFWVICLGSFAGGVTKGLTGFGSAIVLVFIWVSAKVLNIDSGPLTTAVLCDCVATNVSAIPLLLMTQAHKTADPGLCVTLLVFKSAFAPLGALALVVLNKRIVELVMGCCLALTLLCMVVKVQDITDKVNEWRCRILGPGYTRCDKRLLGHVHHSSTDEELAGSCLAAPVTHPYTHTHNIQLVEGQGQAADMLSKTSQQQLASSHVSYTSLHVRPAHVSHVKQPDTTCSRDGCTAHVTLFPPVDGQAVPGTGYGHLCSAHVCHQGMNTGVSQGGLVAQGDDSSVSEAAAKQLLEGAVSLPPHSLGAGGLPPVLVQCISMCHYQHHSPAITPAAARHGNDDEIVKKSSLMPMVEVHHTCVDTSASPGCNGHQFSVTPGGNGHQGVAQAHAVQGKAVGAGAGAGHQQQEYSKAMREEGDDDDDKQASDADALLPKAHLHQHPSCTAAPAAGAPHKGPAAEPGLPRPPWSWQHPVDSLLRWGMYLVLSSVGYVKDKGDRRVLVGGTVAGSLSGLMDGMTGMGGPPVMYLYSILNTPKEVARGVGAIINLIQFRLAAYIMLGVFQRPDTLLYIMSSVLNLIGTAMGALWLNKYISQVLFMRILTILMLCCFLLLMAAAAGLTN